MYNEGILVHFMRRPLYAFDLWKEILDNKEAPQGAAVSLLIFKYLLEVTVTFLWSKTHRSLSSHIFFIADTLFSAGLFSDPWKCANGLPQRALWDIFCLCLYLGVWWGALSRSGKLMKMPTVSLCLKNRYNIYTDIIYIHTDLHI